MQIIDIEKNIKKIDQEKDDLEINEN